MSGENRACTTCQEETAPQTLEAISGDEKELSLTVRGLPVLACKQGHKQFVRLGFALELLNHLIEEDEPQLPAGEQKGLLFKHYHCNACGEKLEAKPDHRHTFTIDVALPDTAPFKVELTSPVYKCSACQAEQLHSLKEVKKLTPEALVHAFKAADISSK